MGEHPEGTLTLVLVDSTAAVVPTVLAVQTWQRGPKLSTLYFLVIDHDFRSRLQVITRTLTGLNDNLHVFCF
jgi:hypothetical protein